MAVAECSRDAGRSHKHGRARVVSRMTAPAKHVWIALLVVYVVWGSTYFGIKIAVETIPPLLAAGSRFLVAALLLAALLAWRGTSLRVTRAELVASAIAGGLLLGLGVGLVHVAETRIDSSIAAMIAGTVPLQIIGLRLIARREPCASHAPQHARRPRRPPARRRTRPRRGIDCARTRGDDLRHDLLVDGLVPVEAPRAPARSVRRDRLGDGARRLLPDGRRARVRRVRRPRLGDVRARLGSRLGLPRDHGLGRGLLGVRVAPEGRADLARRHAPVREPAGRDRARDGVPRRAAEPVGTRRRRTRDRCGLRRDPREFPRKTRPASVVPRGTPADQTV